MTSLKPRREHISDPQTMRAVDSIHQSFRRLDSSFFTGTFVELATQSGAGTVRVNHKLGRVPQGFIVTKLVRSSSTTSGISIYLRQTEVLNATAMDVYTTGNWKSCTLWVF